MTVKDTFRRAGDDLLHISKVAADILDYSFDWSNWLLAGETITYSLWTTTTGLTITQQGADGHYTTVWVSGGTAGTAYPLNNEIRTSGGRTAKRTFVLDVATTLS